MTTTVLLVGCGRMGRALVGGWLAAGEAAAGEDLRIVVVEPAANAEVPGDPRLTRLTDPADLPAGLLADVMVFAVKPQAMAGVAPPYRRFIDGGASVLSIAAGRTIRSFERLFGEDTAVIRAMPNTPAAIGRGITAVVANPAAGPADRALCTRLLEAIGEVVWLDDEAAMDAVTAVSGSGPAYVFLLAEALTAAGIAAGLAPDLAGRLAVSTVTGAAALLQQSGQDPATLRRNVTSPGGTTAAALDVLMAEGGLPDRLAAAVAAAAKRSRVLADQAPA